MTEHVHECKWCTDLENVRVCSDAACPITSEPRETIAGLPIADHEEACTRCSTAMAEMAASVAEVDDLPNPVPGTLSFAAIDRVVARATRAALDVAARRPEDAPSKFADHVDPLYAKDPTRPDPDVWARNGAVMGAKAGWSGNVPLTLPPDCPPGAAARCYMGAWSFACGVVMQIRLEVGQC
jgi:hypothetical protein